MTRPDMELKLSHILHVERPQHQDVLVFESEAIGNVIVLGGVVQSDEVL